MALEAHATKVFDSGDLNINSGSWGVVSQRDGSFIFGYYEGSNDFPYPAASKWYRSTNNGNTWAHMGDSEGIWGMNQYFGTNLTPNIVLAPYYVVPTEDAGIMRSTNGGFTWASVYSDGVAPSPSGRIVEITGMATFNRTSVLAYGELDGNNGNPPKFWGTSTDGGTTWTLHDSWDIATPFDYCNLMAVAQEGRWYAQYTQGHTDPRTSKFARTDNFGTTWTVLHTMGSTGSPPNPLGRALCSFDRDKFCMAGQYGADPAAPTPGVWWSDDGGSTLNLVSAGDINGWPTPSGQNVWAYEVKRLTQDACVLAWENLGRSSASNWAISTDQGKTFPTAVEMEDLFDAYRVPFGKIVVTPTGSLLLPLWSSETFDTGRVTLWKAPLTC